MDQNHHRQSIRLPEYDYSLPGAYFVTIGAYQMEEIFGWIEDDTMYENHLGKIVREEWLNSLG